MLWAVLKANIVISDNLDTDQWTITNLEINEPN